MTFSNLDTLFMYPSKDGNFPYDDCKIPFEGREDSFIGVGKYMCLIYDPEKPNKRNIRMCTPFYFTYDKLCNKALGWMDLNSGSSYSNIEGMSKEFDYGKYVIGFWPFEEDYRNKAYDEIIRKQVTDGRGH